MAHIEVRSANPLIGRVMFRVDGVPFLWDDAVVYAMHCGIWQSIEQEARTGLAAERQSTEAASVEAVDAAAAAFRRTRKLQKAEDVAPWFEERGLTVQDWLNWLSRTWHRQRLHAGAPEPRMPEPPRDGRWASALLAEAVCSGRMADAASRLSIRAALSAATSATVPTAMITASSSTFADAVELARFAGCLGGEAVAARFDRVAAFEACFREQLERPLAGQAVREQLEAHRLDWLRLQLRTLRFTGEAAAREGLLCLREDGEPPEEVAFRARAMLLNRAMLLEEVEPALREQVLSAKAAEWIGPISSDGSFVLLQVLSKQYPAAADPGVGERAKQRAFTSQIDREVALRVKWELAI